MFGFLSAKVYLMIAVVVGGLCSAVAVFDKGEAFANLFRGIATDAQPFLGNVITNFIFTPLELIFSNIYWAIGAGILWPLIIIWFIFFFIALGATVIGPAFSEINSV